MDFHKLQHTLFNIEPTNPAEDLAKLQSQANDSLPQKSVENTKNYVQESVNVAEGSMPVDREYSISDFAKLAGVTLTEGQKKGSAGQLKGKDAFTKSSKPGGNESPHPARNKLVGDSLDNNIEEGPLDAFQQGYKSVQPGGALGPDALTKGISNVFTGKGKKEPKPKQKTQVVKKQSYFNKELDKYSDTLNKILADPMLKKELLDLIKKAETKKEAKKNKKPVIKARDPNWRDMEALRKSGAAGSHGDKTKVIPRKEKYKKDFSQESIKEMLYRKLAEKSS